MEKIFSQSHTENVFSLERDMYVEIFLWILIGISIHSLAIGCMYSIETLTIMSLIGLICAGLVSMVQFICSLFMKLYCMVSTWWDHVGFE